MFGKKKASARAVDLAGKIPTIRISICTGEQTAGFRDEKSGRFTDVMLIRDRRDLERFMGEYGLQESDIKREW